MVQEKDCFMVQEIEHLKSMQLISNINLKSCLKHLQVCLNSSFESAKERYYQKAAIKLNNIQKARTLISL